MGQRLTAGVHCFELPQTPAREVRDWCGSPTPWGWVVNSRTALRDFFKFESRKINKEPRRPDARQPQKGGTTMTTKKFKTVSGYLRSTDERMLCQIPRDASDDARIAAIKAGQRDIINNLLPQLGLPKLDASEPPRDGVERLLAAGGTDKQVKALKDCQRWLKNYRIVTNVRVSVVPQVKTAQGLVSYHVCGFRRDNTRASVSMIVDGDELTDKFEIAEAIAGPDYCFHASMNITHIVPDAAKNKLFMTDEELYAAVPELNPQRHARRAAR